MCVPVRAAPSGPSRGLSAAEFVGETFKLDSVFPQQAPKGTGQGACHAPWFPSILFLARVCLPPGSVFLQGLFPSRVLTGGQENREGLTSTKGPPLQPPLTPATPALRPPCPRSLEDMLLSPQGLCTAVPSAGSAHSEICALPSPSCLCSQVPSSEQGGRPDHASSVALLAPPLIHWFIFGLSCTLSASVLPASGRQGESVCPVLFPASRAWLAGRRPQALLTD